MFILDSTTKSLKAVLAASATSSQPEFTVAYADNTGSAFTEGSSDGTFSGTSDITLVAAPGSSTRRMVKSLFIYNRDSVSHEFTIKYDNNGTQRHTHKFTLGSGETWNLDTNTVSSTSSVVTTGSYLPVQYLVVGGGGGGGSGTPPYANYAPSNLVKPGLNGGGGGAGGFVEGLISLELGRAYPLKIGAGGAGGVWNFSGAQNTINTASNTSGKNGEDSVLGTESLPVIAYGGGGGVGSFWNSYQPFYPGAALPTLTYTEVAVSAGGSIGAGFLPDLANPATVEPTAFAYRVEAMQQFGPYGGFGNRGHLSGPYNTGIPYIAASGAANAFPNGYGYLMGGGGGAGSAGSYLFGGGGKDSSITGTPVTYAGGGGGGYQDYGTTGSGYVPSSGPWTPSSIWTANRFGSGGPGGGGDGALMYRNTYSPGTSSNNSNVSGFNATSGTANTGGGGGGGGGGISADTNIFPSPGSFYSLAGSGGSGIIILRIPSNFTATFSSGVTNTLSTAVSGFKIYRCTAGSGTVTFS